MMRKCLEFWKTSEIGKYRKFVLSELLMYYLKEICITVQF